LAKNWAKNHTFFTANSAKPVRQGTEGKEATSFPARRKRAHCGGASLRAAAPHDHCGT
jgi:hypothetical protein